uniref:Uncharacterized protein n=1 Tax=Nelumbo nucifera TaxID=4432 RepID=A0A822XFM1_NELNU|nr:TPA_asm: hypothetical protein HUJ06_020643 [Nelumbo nucifera]
MIAGVWVGFGGVKAKKLYKMGGKMRGGMRTGDFDFICLFVDG